MIYFDSGATTLEKPSEVLKAVNYAISHCASPGRGGYSAASDAAQIIYRCRETAAEIFEVPDPEHVVLTCNATHGLNIAIQTLVKPGKTVLISGYEHNAVTRPLHAIPNVTIRIAAAPLFDAEAAYQAFEKELTEDVDVVICNHVSNVFGFIAPIDRIAELCIQRGKPLIVDASQSAGTLPVSMERWNAAFIAMPGHKGLYGPQGTGLLLCGKKPEPILQGGTGSESLKQTMPEFLPDLAEAGTHNVCGAAGLLAGMLYVKKRGIGTIFEHEANLCHMMSEYLSQMSELTVFCSRENHSGLFSFNINGMDCERVGTLLAERGVAVRSGLHCAPLAHKTAGTLATGTVRISFSAFNRKWQIERVESIIRGIIKSRGVQ